MQTPRNLISDSSLVQETFDFAREHGGRVELLQITQSIFQLNNATPELATALIRDLIQNDPRFSIEGSQLKIHQTDIENQPLNEINFVVVDIEAIGGRGIPSRMIEIGACSVCAGEVTVEYETLVNPELPLPPFISNLTGITSDMLSIAPAFAEVVESWLNFAGDSVLVAHNSIFDITLLNYEIGRVFPGCRMRNAELCTVELARRLLPSQDSHNLDALAEHFGFEISHRHRAAGDARATAQVLLRLLDELEIHGVRTLAQAREFRVGKRSHRQELQLAFDS